ncbi:MAG: hypothetical protein P4M13_05765 [Alphaproteobacteria bacterium]|nr:hypothetical protein [Alphaproteobacteria bacterium]
MTDYASDKKYRAALLASVAANIFLVAFTLGRFSAPDMPPPMGAHGMFPPGIQRGEPMPPPFFGPGDLFGPGEIREDETRMRENFEKMNALRQNFAKKLQSGPVSKEDVLKHFADVGQVMEGVKKEAQEKAAEKISAMSAEDRDRLAQTLLSREGGPPPRDP